MKKKPVLVRELQDHAPPIAMVTEAEVSQLPADLDGAVLQSFAA
jgi:hypothetical protein